MIQECVIDGLNRYWHERCTVGHFLTAVLENDLMEAACRADVYNEPALAEIAKYVVHTLPTVCYGSKEKVHNWLHPPKPEDK